MQIVSNHSQFRSFVTHIVERAAIARLGKELRRALHESRTRQATREIHAYRHLLKPDPDMVIKGRPPGFQEGVRDKSQIEDAAVTTASSYRRSNVARAISSRTILMQRMLMIASIVFFASIHIVALHKVGATERVIARKSEKIVSFYD